MTKPAAPATHSPVVSRPAYDRDRHPLRSVGAGILGTILLAMACSGLLLAADRIGRWERAHGFPFGHLCDLYDNCRPSSRTGRAP